MRSGPESRKNLPVTVTLGLLLGASQAFAGPFARKPADSGPSWPVRLMVWALALGSALPAAGVDAQGPDLPDGRGWLAGPCPPDAWEAPALPPAPVIAPAPLPHAPFPRSTRFTLSNPSRTPWFIKSGASPMDLAYRVNQDEPIQVRSADRWQAEIPAGATFTLEVADPQGPGGWVTFDLLQDRGLPMTVEVALGHMG
jgi:hypothetical protein